MLFNSMSFGIFIVIVFLLYYLVPHRYRWCFLLAASYAFYMNLHIGYGLLLFGATALTYILARRLEHAPTAALKKRCLLIGILPLVLILLFYKTAAPVIDRLNLLVDAGRQNPGGAAFRLLCALRLLLPAASGRTDRQSRQPAATV